MTGRPVTLEHGPATGPRGRRRLLPLLLGGLLLLTVGVVIGTRFSDGETAPVTAAPDGIQADRPAAPAPKPVPGTPAGRTEAGAVTAAANAITAFDADVVLDEGRLRETVQAIAATDFREPLLETYRQGAGLVRERLAIDSTPRPVFFVRTALVGYRVEQFATDAATVAVWTVGIVGSGATVQPQQSWRTQRVSLVWEDDAWKVAGFADAPGPTPPLARAEAADGPTALFQSVPTFTPFGHAAP